VIDTFEVSNDWELGSMRGALRSLLPVLVSAAVLVGCVDAHNADVAAVPVTSSAPGGPSQAQIDECVRLSIERLARDTHTTFDEANESYRRDRNPDAITSEPIDGGWLLTIPSRPMTDRVHPAFCEVIAGEVTAITPYEMERRGKPVS